jgi:CheY-like chemotaxis protein
MIRSETPRYSAVFMDHMMPGMDGVEATRIIREELDTDYARNLPIIMLTANAVAGNKEMFLRSGFQDFISKPIDLMKLDAVLRRWVRHKEKEAPDAVSGARASAPPTDAPRISGVDTLRALERFNGDETIFFDVLRSYAVNTRPLLDTLERRLAEGNMEEYAIAVHGVKGASYGICAQKAGKAAEVAELAAKAGNIAAVRTRHAAFMTIATPLLDAIEEALAARDPGQDGPAGRR